MKNVKSSARERHLATRGDTNGYNGPWHAVAKVMQLCFHCCNSEDFYNDTYFVDRNIFYIKLHYIPYYIKIY